MIGGKIVEVIEEPERIFLNVQDPVYLKDRCAIYVERDKDSERIKVGDKIWWQGKFAYWTSQFHSHDREVAIKRASYSGVDRPRSLSEAVDLAHGLSRPPSKPVRFSSWENCPLCGSTFIEVHEDPILKPEAVCTDCGISLQGDTVFEIKAKWNKRHPPETRDSTRAGEDEPDTV